MNRIDRPLQETREWSSPWEVPVLRFAAFAVLGIALIGTLVVLFHVQSPRGAALVALIGAVAGAPFFRLGRRHARRAGNKSPARSYNL